MKKLICSVSKNSIFPVYGNTPFKKVPLFNTTAKAYEVIYQFV